MSEFSVPFLQILYTVTVSVFVIHSILIILQRFFSHAIYDTYIEIKVYECTVLCTPLQTGKPYLKHTQNDAITKR